MAQKYNILVVDCDEVRLQRLTALFQCNAQCCIDPRTSISKDGFESGTFDLVMIHAGNHPEGECVEDGEWVAHNSKVALFSGGYSQNKSYHDGIHYFSASYLLDKDVIEELLIEVLEK